MGCGDNRLRLALRGEAGATACQGEKGLSGTEVSKRQWHIMELNLGWASLLFAAFLTKRRWVWGFL